VKVYGLLTVLLLIFGCHNNAHIRTQKILEKGEYNTLSYHYNSYQNKFFSPWKRSNKNIIPVVSGSLSWVFSNHLLQTEILFILLILYKKAYLIQKQKKQSTALMEHHILKKTN
tara:strand:- start:469 stop:810 length:342 start_codon:yes stop_codon:yes gene_type:complete